MKLKEKLELFKEKKFTYNKETGDVLRPNGKKCISKETNGYLRCTINVDKKEIFVKAHQLAWYLETGEVPTEIDHIDHDKTNNKFNNLRNGDRQLNQHNNIGKGFSIDNNAKDKKFFSSIVVNKKQIFLGRYKTAKEARQSYLDAKALYHPDCPKNNLRP